MEQNDDVDSQKRVNTNKLKNSHEAQHIPRSKQKRSITHIGLVFSLPPFSSPICHAMPCRSIPWLVPSTPTPFSNGRVRCPIPCRKPSHVAPSFHTLLLLVLSCSQAHRVVSFSHPTFLVLSHSFTLSPSLPGTLFFLLLSPTTTTTNVPRLVPLLRSQPALPSVEIVRRSVLGSFCSCALFASRARFVVVVLKRRDVRFRYRDLGRHTVD